MAAEIARWSSPQPATAENEIDRLIELESRLERFGFLGDYAQVIHWFGTFQQHGVYPFGRGVWEDQPEWLLTDFETIGLLQERQELRRKHPPKTPRAFIHASLET